MKRKAGRVDGSVRGTREDVGLALSLFFIAVGVVLGILAAARYAAAQDIASWESHSAAGVAAYNERRLEEAVSEFREALRQAELLSPSDWRRVVALDNLADALQSLRRDSEAQQLYIRALKIAEELKGDDLAVLDPLKSLAWFYQRQRRYVETRLLYERARIIVEKQYGPNGPQVAAYLTALADLAKLEGDYEQAERLTRQALALAEPVPEARGVGLAIIYSDLAWLARVTGRNSEAAAELQRSLTQFKDDSRTAEAVIRAALSVRENALGPDHPSVAKLVDDLATVLEVQGRLRDAEAARRRGLAIVTASFGDADVRAVPALERYADLLRTMGREGDARTLEARAAAIWAASRSVERPNDNADQTSR